MEIILAVYIIFLLIYIASAGAVLWQIHQYAPLKQKSSKIIKIFLMIVVVLIIISLVLFFTVPWNEIQISIQHD